jgi:hypothetical protein
MGLQFNTEEEAANDLLLDFMQQLRDWELNCNADEMARAIHALQMFVFQHALQRTDSICGQWYGNTTT